MYEPAASPSDLRIDNQAYEYLESTAKWAKFLSIVGFIMIGFMLLAGLFAGSVFTLFSSEMNQSGAMSAAEGTILSVVYFVFGVIYFFPCLFLFQFSSRMLTALHSSDQATLNSSLSQLKACFKFFGIVTIVCIGMYILFILALIGGGMTGAFNK
jgi:hypothetical protein